MTTTTANLAWGIIGAAIYLMGILGEHERNFLIVRAACHAADTNDAMLIKKTLPEPLANFVSDTDLETMPQKWRRLPDAPVPTGMSSNDARPLAC
jgi:hypothetical protein